MENQSDIKSGVAYPESKAGSSAFRTLLSTLGFYLFLTFGTLAIGSAAILLSWLPPHGDWVFRCARLWSRGLLAASGVSAHKVSAADGDGSQPAAAIYMANHQSLFDIPALIMTLPGQSRFMAKRSLFYIPIFGWALALGGFVPVDRANRRAGSRTLKISARRLTNGTSIVIFPEETRSRDGNLLPFKTGGVVLAIQAEADIVPVGIRGAYDVRRRGSWLVRPGRIDVHYGARIASQDFDLKNRKKLVRSVRREVADLSGKKP